MELQVVQDNIVGEKDCVSEVCQFPMSMMMSMMAVSIVTVSVLVYQNKLQCTLRKEANWLLQTIAAALQS